MRNVSILAFRICTVHVVLNITLQLNLAMALKEEHFQTVFIRNREAALKTNVNVCFQTN